MPETLSQTSQGSGGVWVTRPFQNWKKAIQKMKAHATSETHVRHLEAELLAKRGETVIHQLQRIGDLEKTGTEMLSSHFFIVLISSANNTFLTQQISTS